MAVYVLRAVRFAIRRKMSFSGVLVLALTATASAALLSVSDPLLFAPLPYRAPSELITIAAPLDLARRLDSTALTKLAVQLDDTPLLSSAATLRAGFSHELAGRSPVAGVEHYVVGPAFFETLGVRPVLGRTLTESDIAQTPPTAVVIAESLWAARFSRDTSLPNRRVRLGEAEVRVVGIIPDGAAFPLGATVWSIGPRAADSQLPHVARLAPRVTRDQFRSRFPGLIITPLEERVRPKQRVTLWLVLGSALTMAFIGWLQLAMIRLSEMTSRLREFAIHTALGASRGAVRVSMTAEAFTLFVVAAPLVLMLLPSAAALSSRAVASNFTGWDPPALQPRTYVLALLITAVGALVYFGAAMSSLRGLMAIVPSMRQAAESPALPLVARTRAVCLGVQVAVTVSLLYGSALAFATYSSVTAVPLGYDPDQVFAMSPSMPLSPSPAERLRRRGQFQISAERIRTVPGVLAVATALRTPLQTAVFRGTARVPGAPEVAPRTVRINYVSRDYFRTLAIPILEGQPLDDLDGGAVIDSTLANDLATLNVGIGDVLQVTSHREPIVGIVPDVAENLTGGEVEPQVYISDVFGLSGTLLVRTGGSATALTAAQGILKSEFRATDEVPALPLRESWRRATAPARTRLVLLVVIAAVSLVLALVGLAGNVSYLAHQKRREIALRVALGATPSGIRSTLLARIAGVVVLGSVAGVLLGLGAARITAWVWYGVEWLDVPAIFAIVAGFLVVAGFAVGWPLQRALRFAPARLLREE